MEKTFEFGDYKVTTYCEDDLLFNWKLSHNGTDSEDWLAFFTTISQPKLNAPANAGTVVTDWATASDLMLDRIADLETSRENTNSRFYRNEGYHQKVLERLEKLEKMHEFGGEAEHLTDMLKRKDEPKPEFTEADIVPGLKVMHPFFKENGLLAQTGEFSFAICLEKVETRRHLTATFAPKGITQYLNTNGYKKGWAND